MKHRNSSMNFRFQVQMLVWGTVVHFTLACSERAGTYTPVNVPSVSLTCTSSQTNLCSGSSSPRAVVMITSASCNDVYFGLAAIGFATANCSGGTCTATVSSWANKGGQSLLQIPSNTYEVCGILDFNNDYGADTSSGATVGDAVGTLSAQSIVSGTSSLGLSSWRSF